MPRLLANRLPGATAATVVALLAALGWPAMSSGATAEFDVHGSHGYRIEVKGSAGKVTLSASGPAGFATYQVPGRVSRRGIVANFGRRGMVDVAFRPGSRMQLETPPSRCEGKPRANRWGAFVGTIRFRGERGFTRVRVRRATGHVETHPRWKCERGRSGGRRGSLATGRIRQLAASDASSDDPVILELVDRRRRLEVAALALGLGEGFSLTAFNAEMRERRGRMLIRRSVFELGADRRPFAYDESLTEATVTPPAPFAGRGTFRRRPGGGGSWTGSLSVALPGTARISLVGPRFRARLYRLGEDGIARPGT